MVSTGRQLHNWPPQHKTWVKELRWECIYHKYTNFFLSLTNVMVRGVSLNNPTAAAHDFKSSTFERDNERGETQRSSSLVFCSIFQHLRHNRQKNNKATRSWGLSEPYSAFSPSSSRGSWRNMQKKKKRKERISGWWLKLLFRKIINHRMKLFHFPYYSALENNSDLHFILAYRHF